MQIDFNPIFTRSQYNFFADNINSYIVLSGGYGSGKSETGKNKLICNMLQCGDKDALCVAPTDRLLKTGMIPRVQKTLMDLKIKNNLNKELMILNTGIGSIYFRAGAAHEKIVDFEVANLWIDEPGVQDEEVKNRALARVRQVGAKISQRIFTGTPEPGHKKDWWGDFVENDFIKLYFASTLECVQANFIDGNYINELKKVYSEKMLDAYINGKFINIDSNLFFYNFRSEIHAYKNIEYNEKLALLISFDFNVNPYCVSIAQRSADNYKLNIIDEIHLLGSDTMQVMDQLIERYGKHIGAWVIYGDASARARDTRDSKKTDMDIITRRLLLEKKNFMNLINTSNPPIRQTQNMVNGLLAPADGFPKLEISKNCKYIIKDFINVTGEKRLDESKGLGHFSDNIRYLCSKIFNKYSYQ
ncbi:MAG: hypothetical protein D4S01_06960 [Dehalococcoidia bacterium]|nr:MAG: hypothetical protein D4S01_06960 [Dehalococcoidia bacterium]